MCMRRPPPPGKAMERQWQRQRQKNGFPSRRPNEIEIEIEEVPSKVTLIFICGMEGP